MPPFAFAFLLDRHSPTDLIRLVTWIEAMNIRHGQHTCSSAGASETGKFISTMSLLQRLNVHLASDVYCI